MKYIRNNLSGSKFNRLTVIEPMPRKINERTKYKCLCDCGKETIVEGSKIKNWHTKSCGCFRETVDYGHNRLEEGLSSRNALIYNYKYNAKKKGIVFNLSDDEMIDLFGSDCFYCGREPYMVTEKKGANGGFIFTGIDRLDNNPDIGYCTENCVPERNEGIL